MTAEVDVVNADLHAIPGVTVVDQNPTAIGATAMDRVMVRLGDGAPADGEAADIMVDAELMTKADFEQFLEVVAQLKLYWLGLNESPLQPA